MRIGCFLLLPVLLAHGTFAQQPAPAQQPPKPAEPCPLVVPASLSINMEFVPQVQCDCRITKFKAKVFSRWGQEVFATEDPARFPNGLLRTEKLQSGTYMWLVEYTAIVGVDVVERKATGYINVL
jgi:hypothetical protein